MNKPNEIIQAWINKFIGDDSVKALAAQRRSICDLCEHKTTLLKIEVCGLCHCPLEGKTYSPENSCPKDKWLQ